MNRHSPQSHDPPPRPRERPQAHGSPLRVGRPPPTPGAADGPWPHGGSGSGPLRFGCRPPGLGNGHFAIAMAVNFSNMLHIRDNALWLTNKSLMFA